MDTYSLSSLQGLNWAWAKILWIERGAIEDANTTRIQDDYLDARRIVGFILADHILESCNNGICPELPEYYYEYLNALSVDEYKKNKAYVIWENNGRIVDEDKERIARDYYEACSLLPWKQTAAYKCQATIIEPLLAYIKDKKKVNKSKISRRKAYWAYLAGDANESRCINVADEYVDEFYDHASNSLDSNNSDDSDLSKDLYHLVKGHNHIANMFEACILPYTAAEILH